MVRARARAPSFKKPTSPLVHPVSVLPAVDQIDGREQVRFFHAMPHNPPGLAGNRQP